jgi:hypothetical protein
MQPLQQAKKWGKLSGLIRQWNEASQQQSGLKTGYPPQVLSATKNDPGH